MKPFKIIISPAKTFNFNARIYNQEKSTLNHKISKKIIKELKKLNLEKIKNTFKLSNRKAIEVLEMHKIHDKRKYRAIELYDGLVFKQLNLNDVDHEWMNKHVIILDALYGIIKPFELISPYRLDFNTKLNVNLKEVWKEEINKYLKDYDVYNLASNEFSSLIEKELINVELEKGQIKKARGLALQKILENRKV